MVMEKFESQFEDLDVQGGYMEKAMGGATTLTTPQDEVETLMQQVADEHGLELNHEMGLEPSSIPVAQAAETQKDELTQRLAALRNK